MIFSKVKGNGLPIVLLHGYGEDHTLWDNLVDSLSSTYKTIAIDLPGFGKSTRLDGQFSIDDVAETVFEHVRLQLGLTGFVLFGHSLGGYVALSIADNHHEDILGLGLVNSTTFEDSPEKKGNRKKTAQFIRNHQASFFLKTFVPNLFAEENRIKLQQEIDFVVAMGDNLDEDLLADYMLAMKQRPDRSHLLNEHANIFFVGGENDAGISLEDNKNQISRILNSNNAHILQNVGHMSMYEAPEELHSIIDDFLKSL